MPTGFHYVYLLVSLEEPSRHYVGITSDLKARLEKHNEGGCPHTAKYPPWRIETAIAFSDKAKAIAIESLDECAKNGPRALCERTREAGTPGWPALGYSARL